MNRDLRIDTLKGYAIFFVVLIHGGWAWTGGWGAHMYSLYGRMAVPAFIILFTYFFERKLLKSDSNFDIRSIKVSLIRLFLPFAFWSLLYFAITADFSQLTYRDLLTKHLSGYGWAGQYFFVVLFQLLIAHPLIRRFSISKFRIFISVVLFGIYFLATTHFLLLPDLLQKLGVRPFVYWLPYSLLGIYLARGGIPRYKSKMFGLLSLLIPFVIPIELYGIKGESYLTASVLFSSILFTIAWLRTYQESGSKFEMFWSYLGQRSLGIFCLNPLVIMIAAPHINSLTQQIPYTMVNNLIGPLMCSLFYVLCCVALIKVLEGLGLKALVR